MYISYQKELLSNRWPTIPPILKKRSSACSENDGLFLTLSGNRLLPFQYINSLSFWQQSNAVLLYHSPHRILVLIQHYIRRLSTP
jgi:hypothetical protein